MLQSILSRTYQHEVHLEHFHMQQTELKKHKNSPCRKCSKLGTKMLQMSTSEVAHSKLPQLCLYSRNRVQRGQLQRNFICPRGYPRLPARLPTGEAQDELRPLPRWLVKGPSREPPFERFFGHQRHGGAAWAAIIWPMCGGQLGLLRIERIGREGTVTEPAVKGPSVA